MASFFDGTDKRTVLQYVDPDGTTLELIKIDAVTSMDHKTSSRATQHEVENGVTISDHVIKGGRMLSLNGVISDTPISIEAALPGNVGGIVGSLGGGLVGAVTTGVISKIGSSLIADGAGKPSKNAMDMLDLIYESSIPLTIVAGLKTYNNMIMEDFSAPQNPRNAGALNFSATFREVRIVESEVVDIPASATANEGVIKKKTEGKKATKETDAATGEKGSSLLFKVFGQ